MGATERYWHLHGKLRGMSQDAQNGILRVVRSQFLEGAPKRTVPYASVIRSKARAVMAHLFAKPALMCSGVIDLAHHNIPGLQNFHISFLNPLWAWLTVVCAGFVGRADLSRAV
jgi:hypothetical protein